MSVPAAVPGAPAAVHRVPGMTPGADVTARRVLPMLAAERVVWLSTVCPDGRPHLVPTWFWWDGAALLLWSKPDAVKVRNLRADPRLMVALGDAGADFSVGLIEAAAQLADAPVPDAFFAKYGDALPAEGRMRRASTYTQAVVSPQAVRRACPTRIRRVARAGQMSVVTGLSALLAGPGGGCRGPLRRARRGAHRPRSPALRPRPGWDGGPSDPRSRLPAGGRASQTVHVATLRDRR